MNLEMLVRKRDYYVELAPLWVRSIWTRPEAFDHFVKYNRLRLTAEGAVVKIGRDYFVVSDRFPIVAGRILKFDIDEHGNAQHE